MGALITIKDHLLPIISMLSDFRSENCTKTVPKGKAIFPCAEQLHLFK